VKLRYRLLLLVAAPLLALAANGVAQAATSYNIQNESSGFYITANGHGHQLTTGGTPAAFLKINCQNWHDPVANQNEYVCELEIGAGSGQCIDQVNVGGGSTAAYEASCVPGDQQELYFLWDYKMISVYYTGVSRNHQELYGGSSVGSDIRTTPEYLCKLMGAACDWKFSALP
jgi:hypothetical protein